MAQLPNQSVFEFYTGSDSNLFTPLTGKNLNQAPNQLLANDQYILEQINTLSTTQATTESLGVVELATQAEVTTGTDATRVVTPSTLKGVTDVINQSISSIQTELTSLNEGQWTIAYEDYTQTANQSSMETSVFYLVPFNSAGQYIQIDKDTGSPSASQPSGATDTNIHHYVKMYKSADGTVQNHGNVNTLGNLEGYAKLNTSNVFTVSPQVPDVIESDNSDKVANTKFVNTLVNNAKEELTQAITDHTIPSATTEVEGKVELATSDEITSGTANKVVTADLLKTVTDTINTSVTSVSENVTKIINAAGGNVDNLKFSSIQPVESLPADTETGVLYMVYGQELTVTTP